ncbi:hypothetical protein RQP46_009065 [Phenoliferia psychrophenolica]
MSSTSETTLPTSEPKWSYAAQLKADGDRLAARTGLPSTRSLPLAYSHLSVRGTGGKEAAVCIPTIGTILAPWTARPPKVANKTVEDTIPGQEALKAGERYLIRDFSGLINAGEMMLVVGRPGSGCTTFLKTLAGLTGGYAGVDGEIKYGSMTAGPETRPYKSQIMFAGEEDDHYPSLSVNHTLDFALGNNIPAHGFRPEGPDGKELSDEEYVSKAKAELLKVLELSHVAGTKVGDAYVRGVSGGQKKRVTIAEALASRSAVQCWDNATRGLDANTALAYAQVMRDLANVSKTSIAISLYQAGNRIYDCFDKVTVIAEGELLYYGPRSEAQSYFEGLGFEYSPGANVADYLTGVTVVSERKIRQGMEGQIPRTMLEFTERYRSSEIAQRMQQELDAHLANTAELEAETKALQTVVQNEKEPGAFKSYPQRMNFASQVKVALKREYRQRWGDQSTLWIQQATSIIAAFIIGSLFYAIPLTTNGLFTRGGVLFISILVPTLISMAETTAAFQGRSVLAKHKAYSMYRASSIVIARTVADFPIFFLQLTAYTLVIYFLAGLRLDAGAFFIYYLIIYTNTLATTALFRLIGSMFGAFNAASAVSGTLVSVVVMYSGYIIQTPQMHPWFSWLRWLDPIYYSLEALMSNEFETLVFDCVAGGELVPFGPGYVTGQNQGCAVIGAAAGSTVLSGKTYINVALTYYRSHLNFGIVLSMWIFFVFLTCVGNEMLAAAGSSQSFLLFKPGGGRQVKLVAPRDEEEGAGEKQLVNESHSKSSANEKEQGSADVHVSNSVFTWSKLFYTVGTAAKPLVLLNDVQGWCKPGTLTALMGSSGAGKTTLLDCLAQRKDEGILRGEVLINGQPLPLSFQRTTGYVEQVDVHLPQATVREALEFSALLRQPRATSDADKLAYVDTIIDLLELHDIQDAIIGVPGAGLGIEQRKRVTIGVELVSKPSLLFADEPTSGLDGQSSFLIVSFLRRLAAAGQAVIAVVHQPSASLFSQFDDLLLMKGGGHTVYFGKIDQMEAYFAQEGVEFPKGVNPAEFMIEVVSDADKDWASIWRASPNFGQVTQELERLVKENQNVKMEDPEEHNEFASTTTAQFKLVLKRASTQLWRNTEYIKGKVMLHITSGLFNGFSFWMINNSYSGLQDQLFTIFNFIFVAPGVIAQLQPKFLANRDIFEAREKKAKIYGWPAFIFGEIVAEIPYLLVCAFLYFVVWYPVVGFSWSPGVAGPVFLEMVLYELSYTGIGQFIAAYAPNATFAALTNPLVIIVLVQFSGVLVPYVAITAFWKYWIYWLNPFNYLMGALLVFPIWDSPVVCSKKELGTFFPPAGQTCGAYMAPFLATNPGYITNDAATDMCEYCPYSVGSEYLAQRNLSKHIDGWRDICITLIFVLSSYSLVFVLMKLRSKKSKSAN